MAQPVVPPVGDRWIYHFTHVDNLEAIRTTGLRMFTPKHVAVAARRLAEVRLLPTSTNVS